jgi:hypothetical protein
MPDPRPRRPVFAGWEPPRSRPPAAGVYGRRATHPGDAGVYGRRATHPGDAGIYTMIAYELHKARVVTQHEREPDGDLYPQIQRDRRPRGEAGAARRGERGSEPSRGSEATLIRHSPSIRRVVCEKVSENDTYTTRSLIWAGDVRESVGSRESGRVGPGPPRAPRFPGVGAASAPGPPRAPAPRPRPPKTRRTVPDPNRVAISIRCGSFDGESVTGGWYGFAIVRQGRGVTGRTERGVTGRTERGVVNRPERGVIGRAGRAGGGRPEGAGPRSASLPWPRDQRCRRGEAASAPGPGSPETGAWRSALPARARG